MELKLLRSRQNTVDRISSNRTFMELKSGFDYPALDTVICSNRTFMELK